MYSISSIKFGNLTLCTCCVVSHHNFALSLTSRILHPFDESFRDVDTTFQNFYVFALKILCFCNFVRIIFFNWHFFRDSVLTFVTFLFQFIVNKLENNLFNHRSPKKWHDNWQKKCCDEMFFWRNRILALLWICWSNSKQS